MGHAVASSLQALATDFTGAGRPFEAIKCLMAFLQHSPMQVEEVTAKLQLSKLLLQHTENVLEAKQYLMQANMLAAQLRAHFCLKCEVLSQLGRAHKYLSEHTLQRQVYQKALQVCEQGMASSDKQTLHLWQCHFYMRLAEAYIAAGQTAECLDGLKMGEDLAATLGLKEQQLLFMVFRLQLTVLAWDRKDADALITEAGALLHELDGPQTPFVQQLGLHFTILQVVFSIRRGQISTLSEADADGKPGVMSTLNGLLDGVLAQQHTAYEWMPNKALVATVNLLAASILKPAGKHKQAMLHIQAGEQAVNEHLAAIGVGPSTIDTDLHHLNVWEARICLALRLLLLECRGQLQALQTNYAAARQDVAANVALLVRFPALLNQLRPYVHFQAGQYAYCVGAYQHALAHFNKVKDSSSEQLLVVAAQAFSALSWLALGTEDAVSQAVDALGCLFHDPSGMDLGYAERGLVQISAALLQLRQGDAASAKHLLSKALKLAHGRLQNHQMVSQILTYMAPIHADTNDVDGAKQMLTSSLTLCKGMGDLAAQVGTLSMSQQLFQRLKEGDKAAENTNYLARKQEELSTRIQAAEDDAAQHNLVVGWDLSSA